MNGNEMVIVHDTGAPNHWSKKGRRTVPYWQVLASALQMAAREMYPLRWFPKRALMQKEHFV